MSPVAAIGDAGWIAVRWKEPERRLGLRVEEREDGRLRIVELWLDDSGGLTSAGLRELPLGAWEAQINAPEIAAILRQRIADDDPSSLDELTYQHDSLTTTVDAASQPTDDGGLEFRFPVGVSYAVAITTDPDLRLEVPSGPRRPDEFYRRVAQVYSWLAGRDRRPAKVLAEANGVPETTVHRWVKEARRRGLLGPGRRPGAGSGIGVAPGSTVIYDPTSTEVKELARRARAGEISEVDIAEDPLLRAWASRLAKGMPDFERGTDPIVQAIMARLKDEGIPEEQRYLHEPLARLYFESTKKSSQGEG